MQGPLLLPFHLSCYLSNETDEKLFSALIANLEDAILFFKYVCEDEKWLYQHSKFVRFFLRWGAKQFYLENLAIEHAQSLVKVIQSHYPLLFPFLFFRSALFFTIRLKVEEHSIVVNSLLFGVCSPILGKIFKHCFEQLNDEWSLPSVSLLLFRQIETYIENGEIPDLRNYEKGDLFNLMNLAKNWGLEELQQECCALLR